MPAAPYRIYLSDRLFQGNNRSVRDSQEPHRLDWPGEIGKSPEADTLTHQGAFIKIGQKKDLQGRLRLKRGQAAISSRSSFQG